VTISAQPPEPSTRGLPETGLGDLIRVAATLRADAAMLSAAAELLGLARRSRPTAPTDTEPTAREDAARSLPASVTPPATEAPDTATPDGRPALPVTARYLPPRAPSPPRTTRTLAELLPEGPAPPPFQGLFPRRRARALLGLVGARRRPEGDLDAAQAIDLVARGKPLLDIPRLWVQTTRGGIQLALDTGPGMEAYQRDVDRLPDQLSSVLGPDGLEIRWFQDCPIGGVGVLLPEALDPTPYRLPPAGTLIVAVTTFGAHGALPPLPSVLSRWHQLFFAADRAGTPVVGLTPLPTYRLPSGLPRRLAVVTWDRAARVQRTTNTLRHAAHNRPQARGQAHRS
jgi:hypothetical protein